MTMRHDGRQECSVPVLIRPDNLINGFDQGSRCYGDPVKMFGNTLAFKITRSTVEIAGGYCIGMPAVIQRTFGKIIRLIGENPFYPNCGAIPAPFNGVLVYVTLGAIIGPAYPIPFGRTGSFRVKAFNKISKEFFHDQHTLPLKE